MLSLRNGLLKEGEEASRKATFKGKQEDWHPKNWWRMGPMNPSWTYC